MLLSQMPQKTKSEIAAEIGVNVGILKASLKSERESIPPENQVERLKSVVEYIKRYEKPGTIDQPSSWIEDNLDSRIITLRDNKYFVFFCGKSNNDTLVALGGSAANLVSQSKPQPIFIGWSFLPYLLDSLRIVVSGTSGMELHQEMTETEFSRYHSEKHEFEWMDLIKAAEESSYSPIMKIKFLAKKLLVGKHPHDGFRGVLATPLYVSMVD